MRETRSLLAVAALTASCLLPAQLSAEDVYVRAGASGRGSKDNPYGELWKAVDRANRGDVIHVAQGVYHGKGGCGHITIGIPCLTLVGGYDDDFDERHPFEHMTVIERAKDYKGDWTGLPDGIIAGIQGKDHSDLTVDGFVLDCTSRNHYRSEGAVLALKAPTYPRKAFETNSANTKLRNCIILNPANVGIYCAWQGKENEVSNCFVLNTMYTAISTRSAQPESKVLLKNNTILFGWFCPGMGGGQGIFIGRRGQTVIDSNVIGFMQTEGGAAGFGVINGFGNEDTIMKNNVFFGLTGGYYKYMDFDKKNLVVWKPDSLEELNDEEFCEEYMLLESGGNRDANPGVKPDKDFYGKYANFVESTPGKLEMDEMNEFRRMLGLPLQAKAGSKRVVLAPAYPRDGIVPNLVSSIEGVGVQPDGPFQEYSSKATAAAPDSFEEIPFESMKKGGPNSSGNDGKAVMFKAKMGDTKFIYELGDTAPRKDYLAVQLCHPEQSLPTRDYVMGYILKGSEAHSKWERYLRRKDRYNKRGGLYFKGKLYDFDKKSYPYPVGLVVIEVSRKK